MNLLQITPGAGRMYCGNCFRDNALVAEFRRLGHTALMVPLYLPLTLDEEDQSRHTPIFFSGVNVYLDQQSPWFRRRAPAWLRHLLSSPTPLRWAAGRAAKTRASDVGDLTVSMLRGEEGNQARDLEELVAWLLTQPLPDIICLSNALLLGMARRLHDALGSPVVCMLQGEDGFLDGLPPAQRERAWKTLAERARDVAGFVAPSRYFADLMTRRMQLPPHLVHVVHNGIDLAGYPPIPPDPPDSTAQIAPARPLNKHQLPTTETPLSVGYFARMCADKGLDILVDAFIALRKRGQVTGVRLRVGGGCGPSDEVYVQELIERLRRAGLADDVDWVKNPDRAAKLEFLQSLTVLSVPARYGEAFGLYVIEALAAGVPVVLPRTASFPELIEVTRGGVLCAADDVANLAAALEDLLLDPRRRQELARAGQGTVRQRFSVASMADRMLAVFDEIRRARSPSTVVESASRRPTP